MMRIGILLLTIACQSFAANTLYAEGPKRPPNVIFILADDLGYGDLGCYGQTKIKTPNIDELAKNGMKFTQCYAGSTVCAPSRCALMTGLHTGHCRTRGNGGGGAPRANVPITSDDLCVANLFKKEGYATALIGKWGLGEENSVGIPTKHGFDLFYGYLNQHHAHNYYPDFLIRNESREPIPQNVQMKDVENVAEKPTIYTPDLMLKESLKFIDDNKAKPFFLYFATTIPHANNEKTRFDKDGNETPTLEPYAEKDWPIQEKKKAAMITRLDTDVGTLLAKLKTHNIDHNTLIIVSSDNGPHREGGNDPKFFNSSGTVRGIKRDLTDGGIRVPGIAYWPGTIKPGTVSDHVWAFWDFPATVADLLTQEPLNNTDGISFLPTLTGQGEQPKHEYLYWEFHEGGFKQAIRLGDYKGIRLAPDQKIQLYDLKTDLMEQNNIAADKPEVVEKIAGLMKTARTNSEDFPIRAPKKKNKK